MRLLFVVAGVQEEAEKGRPELMAFAGRWGHSSGGGALC